MTWRYNNINCVQYVSMYVRQSLYLFIRNVTNKCRRNREINNKNKKKFFFHISLYFDVRNNCDFFFLPRRNANADDGQWLKLLNLPRRNFICNDSIKIVTINILFLFCNTYTPHTTTGMYQIFWLIYSLKNLDFHSENLKHTWTYISKRGWIIRYFIIFSIIALSLASFSCSFLNIIYLLTVLLFWIIDKVWSHT